jgi:iron complex transport system ATP-binding protein
MNDVLDGPQTASPLKATELRAAYASNATHVILDGVSLDLAAGELVAMIGPNGSGKSTLMRSLSRTLPPVSGMVALDGVDLYGQITAREAALRIGVVPQETTVAFEFTVREIVAMGRAPHQPKFAFGGGETEADTAAIDSALRRADIGPEFAARPVSTLSGGERQRVLVARALAQEASILLLDEPTAALDIGHEMDVLDWLRDLASRENRAVLVAMHDLNLAAGYADRVVMLRSGRVHAVGTPESVLTAENILQVYGVDVWIGRHPVTSRPYFLPLPRTSLPA